MSEKKEKIVGRKRKDSVVVVGKKVEGKKLQHLVPGQKYYVTPETADLLVKNKQGELAK